MTNTVMKAATSHFKEKLSGKLHKLHIEEWGVDIYYRSIASMRTESKIMALTQQGKSDEALVETIILKALDKDGERLFSIGDRSALLNEVDPQIIIRIATALNTASDMSLEEIEKN